MAARKVDVMDDNKKKGDGCLKAAIWIGIILTLLAVAHGLFLFAEVFSGQSFSALTSPSGAAGYTVPALLTAGMLVLGLFLIRKFTRKTVFKPFHDNEALRKAKEAYRQKMENPLITNEDRVALQELRFSHSMNTCAWIPAVFGWP
jgi:hypothetical protein